MENLIEKIKGLDKKILIGAGIGVVALIVLIVALIVGLGGNNPNNNNTEGGTQMETESETETEGTDVFVTEGDGSEANPFIAGGTEFEAKVPAEGLVYYQMYKVDGMVLTIADENAYVKYGDKEYKAENGVVSVLLSTPDTYTPASFVIGNTAKEEKTFHVSLGFPQGTRGNPIVLALGEFTANVAAGNDQGVYYTYTATEAGTLTVTLLQVTEGVQYDYTLYNLNTYAMRALSTEGAEVNGNKTVSVEVNAGDEVQISVGTLPNEQNEYPAGDFKLSVAMKASEGNTETPDSTQSPESTEDNNTESGNVNTPAKEVEYTVTVKDESNKALPGVLVTVGDSYATTDKNGKVTFKLTESSYTANASLSGYKTTSKAFGSATSVTITLKKEAAASNQNTKTYTVDVVDYAGNPIKDTAVSFVNGGKTVATVVVGSNGKAIANLEKANYTVEIKFPNGKDYGFDKSTAKLTTSVFTAKVVAAPKADAKDTTKVYDGVFNMQNVYTGGTYLVTNASEDNYFVFKPGKSGKYKVYTLDKNTKVAIAGTTSYFTEGPAYEGGSCETDIYNDQIKAGMQLVISVKGSSECILVVERIGNAGALTTYKDYAAKTAPTAFTLSGISGLTQKFVDVTAGSFKIVLGSDGYYHKGSATGPIMYVVLNSKAQYISMQDLTSYGPLRNASKGEDYTECMLQYINCIDTKYGVYPLTEDLKYMFQQGGKANGWWDKDTKSGYYLFGDKTVNKDIAWMFECCWWE